MNWTMVSSFDEGVPEMVGSSDVQHLGQVGVFAQIDSVLLADVVAVIYQFFVEEVELVVSGDHPYAGFTSKDLFGLDLEGEGGGLPLVEEAVVEDSACLCFEDKGVGAGLEVDYLLVFVEFIMGAAE